MINHDAWYWRCPPTSTRRTLLERTSLSSLRPRLASMVLPWRSRWLMPFIFKSDNDATGGGEEGGVRGDQGQGELPQEGELRPWGQVQGDPGFSSRTLKANILETGFQFKMALWGQVPGELTRCGWRAGSWRFCAAPPSTAFSPGISALPRYSSSPQVFQFYPGIPAQSWIYQPEKSADKVFSGAVSTLWWGWGGWGSERQLESVICLNQSVPASNQRGDIHETKSVSNEHCL